ncbi:MAG: universal stress protein [Niastella sp.]|nr:universal stress protein [Niastella sp.]
MKKVLVAFDIAHFSPGAMEFIAGLNRLETLSLTGVFLPQVEYSALWSKSAGAFSGPLFVPLAEEEEAAQAHAHIHQFESFCQEHHIRYSVNKDFFDFTLNDFKEETKFADLLVIGSELFYKGANFSTLNDYLQDVLSQSACPVILVPERFEFPKTNILAYDGSEASIYAIKQFAYLFPGLCERKTLVVYVDEDADVSMPAEKKLKDLVCRHYDQCAYLTLHLDARKYLGTWISEQQGGILVSGAFGRSAVSRLFKPSFVQDLITEHQLPIFIAHR